MNWLLPATIVAFMISNANAHDWYEKSCCDERHCHPVPDGVVTEKIDGVHVQGYGVLKYTDPKLRWSQDSGDHICEQKPVNWLTSRLICVYRRPKGM